MITKRKLMDWRKAALRDLARDIIENSGKFSPLRRVRVTNDRILKLTQELIDQHLLEEASKEQATKMLTGTSKTAEKSKASKELE